MNSKMVSWEKLQLNVLLWSKFSKRFEPMLQRKHYNYCIKGRNFKEKGVANG